MLQHLFFGLEVEEVVVAYLKQRSLIMEAGVEAVEAVILSAMVALMRRVEEEVGEGEADEDPWKKLNETVEAVEVVEEVEGLYLSMIRRV